MSPSRTPALEISLLLGGTLCVLPFLIPYHQPPIASFYSEWLAAALVIAAVAAASQVAHPVSTPPLVLGLAAFAALLLAQPLANATAYMQPALLACLYCACACLLLWLGAQLRHTLGLHRLATTLAQFILVGTLVNALAGVIQFHGRPDLLEDIVAELRGDRIYGNIAQPNLYANYLALGMASLLFLWQVRMLRTRYAVPALVLLAYASALTLSRSTLLYPVGLAALAMLLSLRAKQSADLHRTWGAGALIILAVQLSTPWLHSLTGSEMANAGAIDRVLASDGSDPRLEIWGTALKVFASQPITGVGMGFFPGAAFDAGLSAHLTRYGSVWVSPHSLPLHLLAETGLVGATLLLGSLLAWFIVFVRRYLTAPDAASWWILASLGIQMMHSMFEAPLWSTHFLALTALLMGIGGSSLPISRSAWRVKAWIACTSLAMTIALALLLKDFVRLDSVRITGTALTLSTPEAAKHDAAIMEKLSHGLLAPMVEYWMLLGADMRRDNLPYKLELSHRVARIWPAPTVLVKRSIYLALEGRSSEAMKLINHTLASFPQHCQPIRRLLEEGAGTDVVAIAPLLERAEATGTCSAQAQLPVKSAPAL